jgi:hypothetical protein
LASVGFLRHTLVFDEGRTLSLDFTGLPCPRLVRHLTGALSSLVGVGGGHLGVASGEAYGLVIRSFVAFIAARHPASVATFDARQLTAADVDAYEETLRERVRSDSTLPYGRVSALVRLLRVVDRGGTVRIQPALLSRLDFLANGPKGHTTPRNAYTPGETSRLREACRADILAVVERLTVTGPELLAKGQDGGSWTAPENVLWHMAAHGPVSVAELFERHGRPAPAFGITPLRALLYPGTRDLIPFLLLFALESGIEIEACKELQVDCLANPSRGRVEIRYRKRRTGTHQWRSTSVRDNGIFSPGRLIRMVMRLTERARTHTPSTDLWLADFRTRFGRPPFTVSGGTFEKFVARHALLDDNGEAFALQPARLRKTHHAGRYLATQGQLRDFAGTGHSETVAGDHYGAIEALRPVHEATVERALWDAVEVAKLGCWVVSPDEEQQLLGDPDRASEALGVAPAEVVTFLGGQRDLWLASCRDFFDSPFGTTGSPCPVPFWGCLNCQNAVVTSRKLPAIVAFLDHMLPPGPERRPRSGTPSTARLTAGSSTTSCPVSPSRSWPPLGPPGLPIPDPCTSRPSSGPTGDPRP